MTITVTIPKEITDYEEKIIFGLSLRKMACLSLAVALGVGTYFLCVKGLGLTMDATSYVIIIGALPLMAMGFIKKNGMPFERYFALAIRHKLGANRLAYKTEPDIDASPDMTDSGERKSRYDWIFEAGPDTGRKGNRPRTFRKRGALMECALPQSAKKGRTAKRARARGSIKAARKEWRQAQRRAEKETKARARANEHRAAS